MLLRLIGRFREICDTVSLTLQALADVKGAAGHACEE
jgi:hypothetical protein